jgi:hypothetical protein
MSAKLVPTFADRGYPVVSATDPHGCILGFLERSRYYFFQVAPQLYSRRWVDPVPNPLLLRKSGSSRNRTRISGSVARTSNDCLLIYSTSIYKNKSRTENEMKVPQHFKTIDLFIVGPAICSMKTWNQRCDNMLPCHAKGSYDTWAWGNSRMLISREKLRLTESCWIATLSTINSKWHHQGVNKRLCGERTSPPRELLYILCPGITW